MHHWLLPASCVHRDNRDPQCVTRPANFPHTAPQHATPPPLRTHHTTTTPPPHHHNARSRRPHALRDSAFVGPRSPDTVVTSGRFRRDPAAVLCGARCAPTNERTKPYVFLRYSRVRKRSVPARERWDVSIYRNSDEAALLPNPPLHSAAWPR